MTTETVTYDTSPAIVLAGRAQQALASANDFVIDSHTMFELAGDDLKQIKSLQKEVEEKRTSITGPLNAALKATNDLFRAPKDYLEKAEARLKSGMVTWTKEQERLAAEARRAAEELARAERERLAKIEREQQEAARAAEEASRKAHEDAVAAVAAGDAKAAEAAQRIASDQALLAMEAQGQAASAAITAQVITMTPAVVAPAKVSGISGRTTYYAELTDLMELVKAVAAGAAPIECLQAETKFLNAQARAFKKVGQLYPGVMAQEERSFAARAA